MSARAALVSGASRGIGAAGAAAELARQLGAARLGAPKEAARAEALSASDAAGCMQGAIADADGGRARTL